MLARTFIFAVQIGKVITIPPIAQGVITNSRALIEDTIAGFAGGYVAKTVRSGRWKA
jgi:hypothetical protein